MPIPSSMTITREMRLFENIPDIRPAEDISDESLHDQLSKNTRAPRLSTLEFRDIAMQFGKKSKEHFALLAALVEDPDVMTRDSGRLNKTRLCKRTKLKPRRVDELLLEMRRTFLSL